MKLKRFQAKVYTVDTKTKLVQLVESANDGEYLYAEAVEPILVEAVKNGKWLNIVVSEEKEGITPTAIQASPV